jgi:hypothetical protein
MNSAAELADAIHSNVGLGECDDDQLAAWSKQSAKASTFRAQVYAARPGQPLLRWNCLISRVGAAPMSSSVAKNLTEISITLSIVYKPER